MAITNFNLLVSSSIAADAGNTLSLKGAMVDGASAIGTSIGSSVTLANATAKLLSIINNITEKAYFGLDGKLAITGVAADGNAVTIPSQTRIVMDGTGTNYIRNNSGGNFNIFGFNAIEFQGGLFYGMQISSAATYGFTILGKEASDGAAKAVVIGNHTALTAVGDKIVSFCSDTGATEKAYINKDGKIFGADYIEAGQSCKSGNGSFLVSSGYPITLNGYAVNGATAVGAKIVNTNALTTAGAKIISFYPDGGVTEKAYIDIDGDVLCLVDANGTAATGTGVTVNKAGVIRSKLFKVTVDYTNFVTNGNTHDFTIWTVPAKTKVVRLIADVTAAFTDGAGPITTITMTAGKTAGGNEYLVSQNVLAGTGTYGDAEAELGAAIAGGIGDVPSWSGTTAVQARFTSDSAFGNGAVTNLTAGSVTFYLETVSY